MVQTNPFADLPISKASAKRERVLSDDEIAEIWRAAGATRSPFWDNRPLTHFDRASKPS
jgi:hypothetical protein